MSWAEMKISDLYKVASSKRVLKSDWKTEGVPFYRGREITLLSKFGYVENDLFITEEMYKDFSLVYGVPTANDIMLTAIGTIGNTHIVRSKDKFYFKDASVLWLKKTNDVDSKFVDYWFKSSHFKNQLEVGLGATVDTLTIGKVQSLKIKIPTLETQQKLVTKLDAIFAEIDKATAAAEANIKNAEALFQSLIDLTFSNYYKSYVIKNFDDIQIDKQIGLVKNSQEQIESGLYKYFKMNNIGNNNQCNLNSLARVNATKNEVEKYTLKKNDFLFNTRNSVELVGKVCLFDGADADEILYNNNILRVRFKSEINPAFILFSFHSTQIKLELEKLKSGTTNVAAIYYKDLMKLKLVTPPLSIQNECVIRFNDLHAKIKIIEKNQKLIISKYKDLKQSILQQAFNGELIKE